MKKYKSTVPEIILRTKSGDLLKCQLKCSLDVYKYFRNVFDLDQLDVREEFIAVFLNQAKNTVGYYRVGVGGMTSVVVDIRLLFRAALECGATAMVVAHNHPSGNLTPSREDDKITIKIKEAGVLLDIRLLDHMILTNSKDNYYSYADEGKIF